MRRIISVLIMAATVAACGGNPAGEEAIKVPPSEPTITATAKIGAPATAANDVMGTKLDITVREFIPDAKLVPPLEGAARFSGYRAVRVTLKNAGSMPYRLLLASIRFFVVDAAGKGTSVSADWRDKKIRLAAGPVFSFDGTLAPGEERSGLMLFDTIDLRSDPKIRKIQFGTIWKMIVWLVK